MILSKLELFNFRKFGGCGKEPGLSITFHQGLNALIGENDAGKTAIIDAIKIVLLTQSNEYIRITDDDFYSNEERRADECRINLTFSDFSENEAKNFIEYLTIDNHKDKTLKIEQRNTTNIRLKLYYRAWKEKNKIYTEITAGSPESGIPLTQKARELLKTVYLKPLRDAQREMKSGRNSRISQILGSHPLFKTENGNKLISIIKRSNEEINKFFKEEDGKEILDFLCATLERFSEENKRNGATIATSEIRLKSILESLSLLSSELLPGLGESNLLFIAAELLLMRAEKTGALNLALIEELEAHLHPQAQLRLVNYLQQEYRNTGIQIIITTHSTTLASKINLKNIVLIKNNHGYSLAPEHTQLNKGDYCFLQRFLDSTKANLFFAKGVIMVEGYSENILIPLIADIIGYPLEKYGISVVNVGSTAFMRYSKIFLQKENKTIPIPVSIVTDCDIKPVDEKGNLDPRDDETRAAIKKKENEFSIGSIRTFVTPRWTLEYTLALSCLSETLHKAIRYAKKIKNSNKIGLTETKLNNINEEITKDKDDWANEGLSDFGRAFKMFKLMQESSGKSSLKSITAQCLAALVQQSYSITETNSTIDDLFQLDMISLREDPLKKNKLKNQILEDENLSYIVNAIKHAANKEN